MAAKWIISLPLSAIRLILISDICSIAPTMLTRCSILTVSLMFVAGCSTSAQSSVQESAVQLLAQNSETFATVFATTLNAALASDSVATGRENTVSFDLKSYQWKNRLLLVFAPSQNSATYQRQMQLFQSQQAGFKERDLLVAYLLTEGKSYGLGQAIDEADVAKVRSRFNVAPQDFRVILVGKDGTAKLHDSNLVEPEVIFKKIDAMPMRRREMRERSRG